MQALKLSTPQTANKSASFSAKENAFKTSNPQIFPSLNPMGALYKQRKVVRPNPVVQEEEEQQQCQTFEPVKKLRSNNGSEKLVPPTGYTISPREENLDQDGFRIPKLPRRLANKNKTHAKENNTQENFMMPETVIRDLKTLQTIALMQIQYQNLQNKKIAESLEANNGQNFEILDQGFDSSVLLNSLYDKLRLEYYTFQMRQLYQMYGNNSQVSTFHDEQDLVWSLADSQGEKINREIHC